MGEGARGRGRSVPRPTVIAIEGLSGAGKTTLVNALAATTSYATIAEAVDRLPRRPSLRFRSVTELLGLERMLLAEDIRRYSEAVRRRAAVGTVVVDTDFLGTLTYVLGLARQVDTRWNVLPPLLETVREALGAGAWGIADRYLYLATSPSTALQRAATAAASHPAGLRGRHDRVGRWEREFFLRRLPLLLPGRVDVLEGGASVPDLVREVHGRLERTVPLATVEDARRVVTWLERAAAS
jgi:thymidylate kinase